MGHRTANVLLLLVVLLTLISTPTHTLASPLCKTGDLYHTYRGHSTEIVCLSFDPHGTKIATGSMDNTAR